MLFGKPVPKQTGHTSFPRPAHNKKLVTTHRSNWIPHCQREETTVSRWKSMPLTLQQCQHCSIQDNLTYYKLLIFFWSIGILRWVIPRKENGMSSLLLNVKECPKSLIIEPISDDIQRNEYSQWQQNNWKQQIPASMTK